MADLYYIEEDYYSPSLGYFVYTADASVSIQTTVTTLCSADKIKDTASNLTCAVTTLCSADKIIGAASSLISSATLNCLTGVIRNAIIAPVSLFSTSMTISVTSSRSIDCSVAVTLACGATVNRSTAVSLSTIVSLSLQADRTRGLTAAITTTVTQSTSAAVISSAITVSIVSQFTQTTAVTRIRSGSQTTTASFTQTTSGNRIRFGLVNSQAVVALTAQSRKTVSAIGVFTASATLVDGLQRLRRTTINLVSTATETVTARATKRAQVSMSAVVNISLNINEVNIRDVFIQSIVPTTTTVQEVVNTTDDQGNVYTLALSGVSGAASQQILLTKYTSRGKLVFKRKTQIINDEGPIAICYNNQNIYTVWSLYSTDTDRWRIELTKWDLFGNVLADKLINNNIPGSVNDIKAFDGSVYVTNDSITPFLIKFDTNFNQQWYKTYDFGTNQRNATSNLWIDSTGITMLGYNDYSGYDTRFTRIDSSTGNIVTTQLIESASAPLGQEVVRDTAGNYYIGVIIAYKQGILKLDSTRQPVWFKVYDGSYFQTYSEPSSLSIDSNDNLYFTYDKTSGPGSNTSIARGIVSMTKDGAIRYDATLDVSTYSRFENTDLRINGDFFQLSGISWSGGTSISPYTQTTRSWVLYQDQTTNYLDNWTRTACGLTFTWTTNTAGTVSNITSYTITNDATFSQSNYTASYATANLIWSNATDYTECVIWVPIIGRSNMTARFTSSVIARRNIGPIISSMPVTATMTVSGTKTTRFTAGVIARATTSTVNTRIRRNIAYLNSTVTVTATAKKLIGTAVSLNAAFTTSATATRLVSAQSNMVAFNTQTTAVVKNARGTITMESRATLSCFAVKTGEVVVQSQSNAIVTASFLKTPQPRLYSFALAMSAQMTVTANKIVRPPIYLNAVVTATTNATYIIVNTFPLTAAFTLTANVSAGKIVIVDLQTNFTSSVVIKKTMYGVISMSAFVTQLSVGTKVTIDPWYQLVVPPETRLRKITQETGILVVDSENRVNIIKEEIRTITVPTETGVWHIPFSPLVGTRRIQ